MLYFDEKSNLVGRLHDLLMIL